MKHATYPPGAYIYNELPDFTVVFKTFSISPEGKIICSGLLGGQCNFVLSV